MDAKCPTIGAVETRTVPHGCIWDTVFRTISHRDDLPVSVDVKCPTDGAFGSRSVPHKTLHLGYANKLYLNSCENVSRIDAQIKLFNAETKNFFACGGAGPQGRAGQAPIAANVFCIKKICIFNGGKIWNENFPQIGIFTTSHFPAFQETVKKKKQ